MKDNDGRRIMTINGMANKHSDISFSRAICASNHLPVDREIPDLEHEWSTIIRKMKGIVGREKPKRSSECHHGQHAMSRYYSSSLADPILPHSHVEHLRAPALLHHHRSAAPHVSPGQKRTAATQARSSSSQSPANVCKAAEAAVSRCSSSPAMSCIPPSCYRFRSASWPRGVLGAAGLIRRGGGS